ncbi:MAG: selenocysteine-specific translation elongation factor [Chthonomonadaceae bacterium]|nr:selenocysteine-specific translation elongation factor [Chthonomonadaceae bacterium]
MAKLIGTAGHVDHGKTSLIRALTGIDADRLPEEKRRGLTIDIGFAFTDLPGVGRVSIVDVPGHERFIANMLVGALGIDVALLCVAADSGVMPQTREHLLILSLLPVKHLTVALTRSDLVDQDMLELCKSDVQEALNTTRFATAPIVAVSSVTSAGLDDLKTTLTGQLSRPDLLDERPWYLPIDRVFSVKGHGTVVTGSLMQGQVNVGDSAILQPGSKTVKVRQIQGHDETVTYATKGQRTALNLAPLRPDEVVRGMTVGKSGAVFSSAIIDCAMKWVSQPKRGSRVRVSIGADEVIGKVYFDPSSDNGNQSQFRLERVTSVVKGQPIIVRTYSPQTVVGGGEVVTPQGVKNKWVPGSDNIKEDNFETAILEVVSKHGQGVMTEEVCRLLGTAESALGDAFENLLVNGQVLGFAGLWILPGSFESCTEKIVLALGNLYTAHPEKSTFTKEAVIKSAGLKWTGKPLERIVQHMKNKGILLATPQGLSSIEHQIRMSDSQRSLLDRVKSTLDAESPNVPDSLAVSRALNVPVQAIDNIIQVGLNSGELVRIESGIVYSCLYFNQMVKEAMGHFQTRSFTASEFREFIGTSRKFAIPILEHLDAKRVTFRRNDKRVFVQTI